MHINTDHYGCVRATDPDMAPGINSGPDIMLTQAMDIIKDTSCSQTTDPNMALGNSIAPGAALAAIGERADCGVTRVGELALTLIGFCGGDSRLCFLSGQHSRADPVVGDSACRVQCWIRPVITFQKLKDNQLRLKISSLKQFDFRVVYDSSLYHLHKYDRTIKFWKGRMEPGGENPREIVRGERRVMGDDIPLSREQHVMAY
ncbi:hypothetical protein STEG23_015107, partial [Scotinomys teguina]